MNTTKQNINNKEEKRIYSMNLASYIFSKHPKVKYDVKNDEENGNVYFIFKEDVSDIIETYRNNEELQKFLSNFRFVKNIIYENRIYK